MIRRLFTILSAASLALWLAAAVLFVRSFWVGDGWVRFHWDGVTTTATMVVSSSGRVWCGWGHTQSTDPEWIATRDAMTRSEMMDHWGRWSGQLWSKQRVVQVQPSLWLGICCSDEVDGIGNDHRDSGLANPADAARLARPVAHPLPPPSPSAESRPLPQMLLRPPRPYPRPTLPRMRPSHSRRPGAKADRMKR